MAIIDRTDNNIKGKWDDQKLIWVEPPTFIDKPKSLEVDPLSILALSFLKDRDVIDAWIKTSPTLQAFFSAEKRSLSYEEISILEQIVKADKANANNPLTDEVADQLLEIISLAKTSIQK